MNNFCQRYKYFVILENLLYLTCITHGVSWATRGPVGRSDLYLTTLNFQYLLIFVFKKGKGGFSAILYNICMYYFKSLLHLKTKYIANKTNSYVYKKDQ